MAEETQKPAPAPEATSTEEVVVVEKPVTEKDREAPPPTPEPEPEVAEKQAPPAAELAAVVEAVVEEAEKPKVPEEAEKITQSVSFKEESNVVSELPDSQKKALEELKQVIHDALNKQEFTATPPPPPPPAKAEEEKEEEKEAAETTEAKKEEPKTEEEPKSEESKAEEKKPEEEPKTEKSRPTEEPKAQEIPEEPKVEEKAPEAAAPAEPAAETIVVTEVVENVTAVDEDGAKTVEAIEETVVSVTAPPAEQQEEPAKATETDEAGPSKEAAKEPEAPLPPEEVSIWGIPLMADERSDVILLKFLRARDYKVKDAFTMIKNTVGWRKDFGIDALLEEDLGN